MIIATIGKGGSSVIGWKFYRYKYHARPLVSQHGETPSKNLAYLVVASLFCTGLPRAAGGGGGYTASIMTIRMTAISHSDLSHFQQRKFQLAVCQPVLKVI